MKKKIYNPEGTLAKDKITYGTNKWALVKAEERAQLIKEHQAKGLTREQAIEKINSIKNTKHKETAQQIREAKARALKADWNPNITKTNPLKAWARQQMAHYKTQLPASYINDMYERKEIDLDFRDELLNLIESPKYSGASLYEQRTGKKYGQSYENDFNMSQETIDIEHRHGKHSKEVKDSLIKLRKVWSGEIKRQLNEQNLNEHLRQLKKAPKQKITEAMRDNKIEDLSQASASAYTIASIQAGYISRTMPTVKFMKDDLISEGYKAVVNYSLKHNKPISEIDVPLVKKIVNGAIYNFIDKHLFRKTEAIDANWVYNDKRLKTDLSNDVELEDGTIVVESELTAAPKQIENIKWETTQQASIAYMLLHKVPKSQIAKFHHMGKEKLNKLLTEEMAPQLLEFLRK